jgi:hypothetical protein
VPGKGKNREAASAASLLPPAAEPGSFDPAPSTPEVLTPARALALYDVEAEIVALTDTAEMVAPEDEQRFLADFQQALTTAADKRDKVAHYLAHLDDQVVFAAAEINRLQERKKAIAARRDRLEGYVSYVIQSLGNDPKGKRRKLEGKTTTMYLQACPASVDVYETDALPLWYQRASVEMPAALWETVLCALDPDLRAAVIEAMDGRGSYTPDKRAIKASLDAGEDVAGARMSQTAFSLRRK